MSGLEDLVGTTPRVRVIEALVRLGDVPVTRAEIAKEAGLFKTTTNRVVAELETKGMIRRISDGTRPTFRANVDSPVLKISAHFIAALDLVATESISQTDAALVPALAQAQLPRILAIERRLTGSTRQSATLPLPNVGRPVNFNVTA